MKTKITVETKAITNYTPDDNALTDVCITNHIATYSISSVSAKMNMLTSEQVK